MQLGIVFEVDAGSAGALQQYVPSFRAWKQLVLEGQVETRAGGRTNTTWTLRARSLAIAAVARWICNAITACSLAGVSISGGGGPPNR